MINPVSYVESVPEHIRSYFEAKHGVYVFFALPTQTLPSYGRSILTLLRMVERGV